MADAMDVKPGYSPDDVAALIETLRGMVELEEGELHTPERQAPPRGAARQGKRAAADHGHGRGVRRGPDRGPAAARVHARLPPDPALVLSAFVMHAVEALAPNKANAIVIEYFQRLDRAR